MYAGCRKIILSLTLAAAMLCHANAGMAQGTTRSLNDDLMYRITFGRVEDVQGLLDKGAETNIYGGMGDTPLILAVARKPGEAERIIRALLAKGADPNFPDKNGIYPLEAAIKEGHPAAIQALLAGGADIHLKNTKGVTMADLATKTGKAPIMDLFSEQLKKEAQHEAEMHNPERLLSLVQQFSSKVCEYTYWSNYLASEQNIKDNDTTREKIANAKSLAEKVGGEITKYFPNINVNSYITYASGSIVNVFTALKDNKTRAENGIGSNDDMAKRCAPIADAARASIATALDAQKKAAEQAAHQAELQR